MDQMVTGVKPATMAATAGDHSHRGEAAEGDEEEEDAREGRKLTRDA